MHDIMTDLYNYICDNTTSLCNDPKYLQAVKAYTEIEEEVKEKIGDELLHKYQSAESDIDRQWNIAVFVQSLHFCARFMVEVLR